MIEELPALTTRVDLREQVAIVTGAGRGIGLGIAEGLAEAGATIVVADLSSGTDVTDEASVAELVGRTMDEHGRIDILVNNAAIAGTHLVEETPVEDWQQVVAVNLTAPFLCSKAVLPHMTAAGRGRIVNLSSVAAKRISYNSDAAYTTTKAGLLAFTRHLAYEVAGRGISVNAICPGPTLTPMLAELATEDTIAARAKSVPRGRLVLPEDIVRAVLFLVSDLADMVCGQAIDVDGGALLGWLDTETYFARRAQ